jgi:transposase
MESSGRGRGRPREIVVLSAVEREELERWVRRPTTSNALASRARMVLGCAAGDSDGAVAEALGVNRNTVGRWRRRYLAQGLDGLVDEPRPGRPRTISDAAVEEVIVRTLETKPKDATHWSTRSMAAQVGLSQTAVSRIWRAFGLQPHRSETWKLSKDPFFIDKVRDVVGLYLAPPERMSRSS